MQCARCKSAFYCNKECQKADWKSHKVACNGQRAQQPSPSFKTGDQDKKPFTAIHSNVFLHDRPEEKTFQLLIDCLRMRQEDEYALEGETMTGSIYNQERTSEKAFRTFISKAKAVPGLLPLWWTDESLKKCIDYSLGSTKFSLANAQEKSDIQETWKDDKMPMKLRMLGEKVYGNTPGGFSSEGMMGMMMGMEGGSGMKGTTLDIASLLGGAR